MSKQSFKLIIVSITVIIMFGIFKKIFGQKDNSQLAAAIKEGAYLVDVRTASEFAGGSVKGAVNIPLDKISSQLAKFSNKKKVVVFCQSGMRSMSAKSILERNGIQNVINGGTWRNVNQVMNE